MCGIVGYIGDKQAQSILLSALSMLEYRGYDSCGIAVVSNGIKSYKNVLRVAEMKEIAPQIIGTVGIGHTRWATCGEPTRVNAHPHFDCTGNIAVVHNGVITNYPVLKQKLINDGHEFVSDTDTEVIPHLIEKYYKGDLEKAVELALLDIQGSYAIAVIGAGENKLVVARKDSPLIIGVGDRETFVASDVPAILDYTNQVIYLDDGDIGVITGDGIKIKKDGLEIHREEHKILWSVEAAQKAGYEHFMLKEIHEQPKVIRDTLSEYTQMSEPIVDLENLREDDRSILILACGTSYNAGLVGKYIMEDLVGVPVRVEIASEFSCYGQTPEKTLAFVISQSGETADVLKAIRKLKGVQCHVVAVTNVVGSSISRIADQTIYTRAGPEISVAATKSFIAQLMVLYWLAMSYSKVDAKRLADILLELRQLPSKVQWMLDNGEDILQCARYLARFENVFFIGRGLNYPIALEGALKLKEISYIHAEGYAAGELKHGPFSLLGENTPVITITGQDSTYESILTNIKEVKARKSPLIALTGDGDEAIKEFVDMVITVPRVDPIFSPVVNTVALQLLAYYTARERDCPIDFPRNLAKSVTVE
ncbi:MAG: glutamine--fructose-6-phosphate transaminase (isomerizing) [Dehalococcoidales bacterium]|nr:glutamine--fructose-6-phosphate transaminase (isomerizing) [Dehalococcoidales bacterium]